MSSRSRVIACCCLTCALVAPASAFSAESPPAADPENQVTPPQGSKGPEKSGKQAAGQPEQNKQQGAPGSASPSPSQSTDSKLPTIATIFEQPGVLTPPRTIVMDPSFQYINSSSNRVALSGYTVIPSLTIGLIDVRNVTSNTYVAALAARYGITSRLECELKVPYVYRSDSTASQPANSQGQNIPAEVFVADGNGIGDVEAGARYQLNRPSKADGPYFIAGVRVKTPTGTDPFEIKTDPNVTGPSGEPLQTELPTGSGFWAVQPSLTALFTSDPAAFFSTVSYMWNMERKVAGAVFDPGDTVGFNFGMGLALNEKTSLSLGYDHVVLGKTKRDHEDLPGTIITHIGTLLIGCSYRLSDNTSLNFSLGTGVTPAASNVQLTVRMPASFLLGGK